MSTSSYNVIGTEQLQHSMDTDAVIDFTINSAMDDELVALNLQLEEVNIHEASKKGKHAYSQVPDIDYAVLAYQQELLQHLAFLQDVICAHSIARAVETDAQLIATLTEQETHERRDHDIATRLTEGTAEIEVASMATESRLQEIGDGGSVYDQCLQDVFDDAASLSEAGPSISYAERQQRGLERLTELKVTCVACTDMFQVHKTIRAPCGDLYCTECLKAAFLNAIKDEGLFPPRCHRQMIPFDLVAPSLSPTELDDFHRAQIEYTTVDRTYCSTIDCGRFIAPSDIANDRAVCEQCGGETCVHCKNDFHEGECQADEALQATLTLAGEQGWRRCYSCMAMVELAQGCNHMTCKCGAQFCYECGTPWTTPKRCRCAAWQEHRLLHRAEQVVDREAMAPIPAAERHARIGRMAQELVEQHECAHPGRFERVMYGQPRKGFRCEMCDARHHRYILRCRRCHVDVCEGCRRNRV